jgi:hypothetical protein
MIHNIDSDTHNLDSDKLPHVLEYFLNLDLQTMMFSNNASRLFLVLAAACNAVTSAQLSIHLGGGTRSSQGPVSPPHTSAITGNIGVSPIAATAITGFSLTGHSTGKYSKSLQLSGTSQAHAGDYAVPTPSMLTDAVSNMQVDSQAAYNLAAGLDSAKTNTAVGTLGGTLSTDVSTGSA